MELIRTIETPSEIPREGDRFGSAITPITQAVDSDANDASDLLIIAALAREAGAGTASLNFRYGSAPPRTVCSGDRLGIARPAALSRRAPPPAGPC